MKEKIKEKYQSMSKSQKKIADYILEHFEKAAFLNAAKMAETVGVSESTAARFASCMGYASYGAMQRDMLSMIQAKFSSEGYSQREIPVLSNKNELADVANLIKNVLEADAKNILDTIPTIDSAAFNTATHILMNARTVYIVGLRTCAPLAEFLHFYLNMFRGNVLVVNTTSISETFEQMIHVNTEDAVVGLSFPKYSMRTLKAMEFANERNAQIISITDSEYSPMNLYSSCNLWAKSSMTSIVDSLTAPLSVINALVVSMSVNYREQLKKNLQCMEDVWNDYQTYEDDELEKGAQRKQ